MYTQSPNLFDWSHDTYKEVEPDINELIIPYFEKGDKIPFNIKLHLFIYVYIYLFDKERNKKDQSIWHI